MDLDTMLDHDLMSRQLHEKQADDVHSWACSSSFNARPSLLRIANREKVETAAAVWRKAAAVEEQRAVEAAQAVQQQNGEANSLAVGATGAIDVDGHPLPSWMSTSALPSGKARSQRRAAPQGLEVPPQRGQKRGRTPAGSPVRAQTPEATGRVSVTTPGDDHIEPPGSGGLPGVRG